MQRDRLWTTNQIVSTPFVWKIPIGIAAGLSQQSLLSEPVYLFEHGSKHILKIKIPELISLMTQPCLGNRLSVYIKVVPGKFDEMLSWPCKEKVRVTFVDQNPYQGYRGTMSRVIDFEKCELPCFRPLYDYSHNYHFIFVLEERQHRSYIYRNDTTLIRVNRE